MWVHMLYRHMHPGARVCVLGNCRESRVLGGGSCCSHHPHRSWLAEEDVQRTGGLGSLLLPKVQPPAGEKEREEAAPYLNAND